MRCCFDRWLCWPAGLLSLLVLLTGCERHTEVTTSPLTVIFTCDVDGRLEPCGCFTGQLGGLSRLSTYVASERAAQPLLVDVGDALEGTADFQQMKYRHVQKTFAAMNFAALNLGLRETRLSARELKALRDTSPVPMLSANVLDASTGQLICESYRIVERGGKRVALVGVVAPPRGDESTGDGLKIEPVETALGRLLPTLRGKADVLVLLAFADVEGLRELARRFYEFDLILGGQVRQPSQQLEKENRSIVLYTTNEAKTAGVLRAKIAGPSQLVPEQFEIALMSEEIPQDVAVLEESAAYRDEVRQASLAVDTPGYAGTESVPGIREKVHFVGTQACAICHAQAAAKWQDTGHAHAFAALQGRRSEADPSCLPCHTVGFGKAGGYRRSYQGEKLTEVGCESCHGPGSEHVTQRESGEKVLFKYRPLGEADCVTCHHGEFSRPFKWEEFWPPIQHGKEPPEVKL